MEDYCVFMSYILNVRFGYMHANIQLSPAIFCLSMLKIKQVKLRNVLFNHKNWKNKTLLSKHQNNSQEMSVKRFVPICFKRLDKRMKYKVEHDYILWSL